jgi:hypothetical protein
MKREFLVTKMVCAKCGSNLSLTYEVPMGSGRYAEGEPTGAAMVQQVVAVESCKTCMEPLHRLQQALAILKGDAA